MTPKNDTSVPYFQSEVLMSIQKYQVAFFLNKNKYEYFVVKASQTGRENVRNLPDKQAMEQKKCYFMTRCEVIDPSTILDNRFLYEKLKIRDFIPYISTSLHRPIVSTFSSPQEGWKYFIEELKNKTSLLSYI